MPLNRLPQFFFVLLVCLPLYAANTIIPGFETILLPLAFRPGVEVTGAQGTLWRGEVWLSNAATHQVNTQSSVICPTEVCPSTYPVGFTGTLGEPLDSNPEGGVLITLQPADAALVTFSNRIMEVTRHAQPQGLQVPVVREEQFITTPTYLLGLKGGATVRTALRLYDPTRTQGTSVTVEVLDEAGVVRASITLPLLLRSAPPRVLPSGFAAIYDVGAVFPVINSLNRYHVRLTPSAGATYWAMASVTDNDTQQVLIVTPQ